ncbi:MAG: M1 family peptidase, partial [Cytophagaceae bacterium]
IMTNPESINQMGNITYGKTASALNILRETVMGKELFDYAFKEYCRRWAFKHPTPADFFRSMQDASAVDLDWFFRGWFYTTDHVDIAMDNLKYQVIDKDSKPSVKDTSGTKYNFGQIYDKLNSMDKQLVDRELHFYEITFKNEGGLIMPLIVEMVYHDNTSEIRRIPVEVWRKNDKKVTKMFVADKPVKEFRLDPNMETADANMENNFLEVKQDAKKMKLAGNK